MGKKYTVKEPFDFSVPPKKPNLFWNCLVRAAASFQRISAGGKITKVNCKGLKPPYLILGNHGSMMDFPMLLKGTSPHPVNWVVALDGFVGRQLVSYNIGMICKRKFTNELYTAKHILKMLTKEKSIVAIYPEARWSICGVNERLDKALGKLVKTAGCPVVTFIENGNFLYAPQWDVKHKRKIKITATMTQIVTREEAATLSAEEIQRRIEEKFVFDQYKWQNENKIKIDSPFRANNLHKVLYRCPHCNTDFSTDSKGIEIWCDSCGKRWEMDEYGKLRCKNGETVFDFASDWYRWERQCVRDEVRSGNYRFEDDARAELIHSAKYGFVNKGKVKLTHGYDGFTLEGVIDGKPVKYNRPPSTTYSCHIEYDFEGRGDCVEFCAPKDTFYVFPLSAKNAVTKIHLATEEIYDLVTEGRNKKAP
ncbi:MAG: hypothetical protein IJU84_00895 [Clostridia bacterium]|nr:hypothetical protein [Clostridia bacterium]